MWQLKKACYRVFQRVVNLIIYIPGWKEPQLLSGPGAVKKLPAFIKEKGISKVLVVTDKGLMGLHIPDGMFDELNIAGVEFKVYDGVQPNPTIDNIEEARQMYVDFGAEAIIAFGGGSSMDCAKAAAARVVRPNRTVPQLKGYFKVMRKLPPFFAVPTTAGTGSETTVAAVVSDPVTHEKYAINDLSLRPKYAVLDPELTIGLPKKITSTTGLDALTHAVEAYIGIHCAKATKEYSEKAISLIFSNLEKCYENGKDLDARNQMLLASFYAGMAFTRGFVGYVHAIGHNLGGVYGIPHGLAMSVILPKMLEQYGDKIYPQLARLADITGVSTSDFEITKAKDFINAIYAMEERMEIPKGFKEIKDEDIPLIAQRAAKEANPWYPCPVILSEEEIAKFIKDKLQIKE
ncbi:MAG: iron-containing alcohol dehydrogenase [Candidatus Fimenecus sp.]